MINEEIKITIETIVNSYIHDTETGKTDLSLPSYMSSIGLTPEQISYAEQVFSQKKKIQPHIESSENRKKEINNIINLIGENGEQIDIFKLHGILYIGNTKNGTWDIRERYVRLSEHNLPIILEDFDGYETDKDIQERFSELLEETITDKLL
jgi:hypothetical protein